jgi:hypothetical protein
MKSRSLLLILGIVVLGASPACAWHPDPERLSYGIYDGFSSAAAAQAAAALQASCPGIVRIEGELSGVSNSEIILRNVAQQQLVLKIAPEAPFFVNGYPGLWQAACPVEDNPFYAVCLTDPQNGLIYFVDAVFWGIECNLLQISGTELSEQWPIPAGTLITLGFDNGQTSQLSLWPACIISAHASNATANATANTTASSSAPILSVTALIPARVFVLCTPGGQIRRIWF